MARTTRSDRSAPPTPALQLSPSSAAEERPHRVRMPGARDLSLPVLRSWSPRSDHEAALRVPAGLGRVSAVTARGFVPEYAMLDKGYDAGTIYDACEAGVSG